MKRNKVIYNEEVLKVTPENEDISINKGKCWKFNKNVSESQKRAFRGEIFKKNIEIYG